MTATRREHDLLGERDVPADAYYGIQTLRALENFNITGVHLDQFSTFINAFAQVKKPPRSPTTKLARWTAKSRTPSAPPATKSSAANCTTNSWWT